MAKWNWKSRYVDPASRIDITERHSRLRWLQNYDIPCSPLHYKKQYCHDVKKSEQKPKSSVRSFTSIQMFHTHTPSFTHTFVTHTISLCHTPSFTYNFVTHNLVLLLDPPPPPFSFLPSPSPLQHVVLIIGRSCLVGLPSPLIYIYIYFIYIYICIYIYLLIYIYLFI